MKGEGQIFKIQIKPKPRVDNREGKMDQREYKCDPEKSFRMHKF